MSEGETVSDHEESRERLEEPRGRRLPLNSKRLTGAHLRQIGGALGLPTGRSGEETRQLIEGKLAERGDTLVQVYLAEEPQVRTVMWLVDSGGPFMQTLPTYKELRAEDKEEWAQDWDKMESELEQLTSEGE